MANQTASVSVPANLLLMGEYAVLEEGGLGIALAPEVRATGILSVRGDRSAMPARGGAADRLREEPPITVTGRLPGAEIRWPGDEQVLGLAAGNLNHRHPLQRRDLRYHIEIDTTPFFGPVGEKRGLGSSAAAVVALTALWLEAADQSEAGQNHGLQGSGAKATVFREALAAHREAQGGKGSGYDVACSTYGGIVLFCGGEDPVVTPIGLHWFPPLRVAQGPAPVRTVGAVARYSEWRASHPSDAGAFLRESNRLVTEFATASDWERAAQALTEYARLAVRLGDTIGVPADTDSAEPATNASGPPDGAVVRKSVGAGNEIAVILGAAGPSQTIASEGLKWT